VIFADLSEIWPVLVIVVLAAAAIGVFWRVTRRDPSVVALERRARALQARVDLDDVQFEHLQTVVHAHEDVYPELSVILLDVLRQQARQRDAHVIGAASPRRLLS